MSNVRDPQLDKLLSAATRPRPELDVLAEVASGLGYVRAERFAERVYESLFYAIATGKIGPGAKLPTELELAALFEVSRPVVRQALEIANGTLYGLVAGVWTRDGGRQLRLARKLRAGQVFVNNYGAGGGVELPFGGSRQSGYGREKGFEALYGFTTLKTIAIRH